MDPVQRTDVTGQNIKRAVYHRRIIKQISRRNKDGSDYSDHSPGAIFRARLFLRLKPWAESLRPFGHKARGLVDAYP